MKKVSVDRTRKFHNIKERVPSIVKRFIRNEHVLYGGKAINQQVIPSLVTESKDFDIFTKNPKRDARALEKELDKQAGGDVFSVAKAKFPRTMKVKNLRGETVADFTQMPSGIKCRRIGGLNVQSIESMEAGIRRTLRNPANAYRKGKDSDNLNRIILTRKLKRGLGI